MGGLDGHEVLRVVTGDVPEELVCLLLVVGVGHNGAVDVVLLGLGGGG